MLFRQNRVLSVIAATSAALAIGTAPALAGEDDDDDETTQVQSSGSGSSAGSSVPQGGVATGAGGMADQGLGGMPLALASGALVLIATGGGLVAAGRRSE